MDRIKTNDNSHVEEEIDGENIRLFTDGDAHSEPDKKATQLNSDWFNGIQEELCRFISSEKIELSSENSGQLTEAVSVAINRVFNEKIEVYRETLNAIREHVRNTSNPLPELIGEENE